ncbi:MAG TPA: glutathione-disulfide reductase [Nevskiaceae bacterium]|nr:glutathione-disulfide reductase [Nevskiaceae bacterium]
MYDHDLVTIGGGSGGVAASRYAGTLGARVALCEQDRMGGTCVIRGCIPKKIFMYAAQFGEAFADAAGYGWSGERPAFELYRLTQRKNEETERLERVYESLLDASRVHRFHGHARIVDPHTVVVGDTRLTAKRILIATGATPQRPPMPGIDLALTSNEILELTDVPEHLLVLGSGYVAMEFASIFRGFGADVTVAFRADLPLKGFDTDIRRRVAELLTHRGIRLLPGFQAQALSRDDTGEVRCSAEDGRSEGAEVVLNAMGRRANTEGLGLEAVGIALGPDGEIPVDEHSRTCVPSIFAIGDVTDRLALTPVAIAEGRAFVDTEFGGRPRAIDHQTVASAVFTSPPIATVGLSEDEALKRGIGVQVFEADFKPMKNGIAGRAERTYMKLVTDAATDRVLGVHMFGTDAPEIVQSLAVAITMGATKRQFDATMAVHPTAAEEFMLMRTPRKPAPTRA